MTIEEIFAKTKQAIIGDNLTITTVEEAEQLHHNLIELRVQLIADYGIYTMPHYRGEQQFGWNIIPGIFRPPYNINNPTQAKHLEQIAIREFENLINETGSMIISRDNFQHLKYEKEWYSLFQAQHAGIRTTLTDWSPEVSSALFFATEETAAELDGQLWCFLIPTDYIIGDNPSKSYNDLNPFEMNQTYLINPPSYIEDIKSRLFENRMYKQKGRFVIASNDLCHVPLNQQEEMKKFLIRIRIPSKHKLSIRKELSKIGMVRSDMYIEENPYLQERIAEINEKVFRYEAGYNHS